MVCWKLTCFGACCLALLQRLALTAVHSSQLWYIEFRRTKESCSMKEYLINWTFVFVFEGEQSDPDQMHVLGREDTEKPSIEKLHSQVNKESLFSRDSLIYTRISFSRKNKHIYFFFGFLLDNSLYIFRSILQQKTGNKKLPPFFF